MKTSVLLSAALLWFTSLMALAYPPSPGFTVFGTLRDEYGWAVTGSDARIRFKNAATGALIAESPVGTAASLIDNYQVRLPMDNRRSGAPYRTDAVTSATAFTIEVVINSVTYFPVPVVAPLSTQTQAAEFLRLDLTLGEDSDADGLSDLWERWQLESAGLDPARLDLLTRTGDPDGDGMTNLAEFISGTFAFLPFDSLSLEIVEVFPDYWSRLEFLAVVDKTYVLERSADLLAWEPAPFGLSDTRTDLRTDWKAPDTIRQTIQTPSGGVGGKWFFRLSVH